MKKRTNKSVRLSKDIIPKEYFITLKPDLEAHTFDGEVKIKVSVKKPTKEITLHSKDLTILLVKTIGKNTQTAERIIYNDKKDTATFVFAKKIERGIATLQIVFTGILSDTMRGFYKSTYHFEGKEHTLATTQFEATDARRCIPCFDEPAQKAIFHVKLVVPINKTAISNTLPTEITEHESGFKVISFAPTPKMSTYLLAFIVGDFEFIEKKTKNGVAVRVYTTPGKKEQGRFALDVAVKCLEFYEKYFDIPYPLNTLDMIALPDFESFAMENWGAITYREAALLVDPKNTALRIKQVAAIVIAHELAHQWFGNLVTMEWWTHLWLNEGFASYIEYLAVDHLFPEWNIWDQFVVSDHNVALSLDALSNTHPIEVPVHHPGEIGEIFDDISYRKGSAIIRMLANYIGEKDFRDGLRYYLKKHSYKNTETIHLWEAFEKISKKPIKKMMHTWTSMPGFPVVSFVGKKNVLLLEQSRFILSGKKNIQTKWMIPYPILTDRNEIVHVFLDKKTIKVAKPQFSWIKGNPTESSFVVTKYGEYQSLGLAVKNKRLSSVDRLGIIRDMHLLLRRGDIDAVSIFEFLKNYKEESEYIVWVEIVNVISTLKKLSFGTTSWVPFTRFIRDLITPSIENIGYGKKTNDRDTDVLLRGLLLSLGGTYQVPQVLIEAKHLFTQREKNPIDPNLRSFVYNTLARTGDEKLYALFRRMYKKEELSEERVRLINAICLFSNSRLLKDTFEFIQKDIRTQDQFYAYATLLRNQDSQKETWIFVKKNWGKIQKQFGETSHMLSRIIGFLEDATFVNAYKDINSFFCKHEVSSAKRTLRQVLEMIMLYKKFVSKNKKKTSLWLTKNFKK